MCKMALVPLQKSHTAKKIANDAITTVTERSSSVHPLFGVLLLSLSAASLLSICFPARRLE